MKRADSPEIVMLRRAPASFACVAMCLILLGCGQPKSSSTPTPQVEVKKAGQVGSVIPRPLKAEQMTQLIYGKGVGAGDMGKWRPKKVWQGKDSPGWEEGSEFIIKPVSLLPFRQGDSVRAFVLMSANAPDNDCHPCGAILGVAALTEVANGWRVDAVEPEVGAMGSFGTVPDGVSVTIGADKNGVLLTPGFSNMGLTSTGLVLITELRNGGFSEILSVDETDSDNSGNCSEDGEEELEPCWQFSSEWQFVQGEGKEFYDFQLTKKGTRPLTAGKGIDEFSETTTYRFDGARYAAVK